MSNCRYFDGEFNYGINFIKIQNYAKMLMKLFVQKCKKPNLWKIKNVINHNLRYIILQVSFKYIQI